ncbi:MAG TPA: hypothetical protein PLI09_12845 [Candidatus Hydrogenedentes bacterium]|nr:hypothetical protein [Candidatus Hydrogenedentota bacterium]
MKNKRKVENNDDLRPEYEAELIRGGVRGKYLKSYREGTNLVLLAPDVAAVFKTEKAVNDALRNYIQMRQTSHSHST